MLALPDDEHFYLVYRELGSWGAWVGGVFIPAPGCVGCGVGGGGAGKDNWPFCYLLEFDEHGYLLRHQTETYKDFENRRMPGCLYILYLANVLPLAPRTLSEEAIEEKLSIVQSPQETPSTADVTDSEAGVSIQPLTVVILPAGRGPTPASGIHSAWGSEDEVIERLGAIIYQHDALVLIDSPISKTHKKPEIYSDPTKLWVGEVNKKPVVSVIYSAAQEIDSDLAVLFFYKPHGDNIDISLYIFDTRVRQIYSSSGRRYTLEDVEHFFKNLLRDVPEVEKRAAEAHRRKLEEQCAAQPERCWVGAEMLARSKSPSEEKHVRAQSQPTGPLKVGLLPPLSAGSSRDDEIEGEIYKEIRRYIASDRSFGLSFDYTARYRAGSLDTHAVWQGTVVKKVPDEAKLRVIGQALGADILVLTTASGVTSYGGRIEVSLYVFDVAGGKMYQGTDNFKQLKTLVESTFAQSSIPR
jgi:hypothetical protein